MSGSRLFLSYNGEEEPLARVIGTAIRECLPDVDVFDWKSSENLFNNWLETLRGKLNGSDAVLFLMSPDSLRKQWILFEYGASWFMNKNIIPIFHSGLEPSTLGTPLSDIQGISVMESDFGSRLLNKLKTATGLKAAIGDKEFQAKIDDALQKIGAARKRFDLFVAAPLADSAWFDIDAGVLKRIFGGGVASADDARVLRDELRKSINSAVDELRRQGLRVRYAGQDPNPDDDRENKVKKAISELRMSNEFVLVLTTMRATGALCEAGFAHALNIPSTYLVRESLSPSTFLNVARTSMEFFQRGDDLKRKLLAKYRKTA